MEESKGLTVKELKKELEKLDDNASCVLPVWNGFTETYALLDNLYPAKYWAISNDFFGTPGKMDKRLFDSSFNDDSHIILFNTKFDFTINKDIDLYDDPNVDIDLINGEQGDHDLFWKRNGFIHIEGLDASDDRWEYLEETNQYKIEIKYYRNFKRNLFVSHDIKTSNNLPYTYEGTLIGLYDFFDIMKACKINKNWIIG